MSDLRDFFAKDPEQTTPPQDPAAPPQPAPQPAPQPDQPTPPPTPEPERLPSYLLDWAEQLGVRREAETYRDPGELGRALSMFAKQQAARQPGPPSTPAVPEPEPEPDFPDGSLLDPALYDEAIVKTAKQQHQAWTALQKKLGTLSPENLIEQLEPIITRRIAQELHVHQSANRARDEVSQALVSMGYDAALVDSPDFGEKFSTVAGAQRSAYRQAGLPEPAIGELAKQLAPLILGNPQPTQPTPQSPQPAPRQPERPRNPDGTYAANNRPPVGAPTHSQNATSPSRLRELFHANNVDPGFDAPADGFQPENFFGK